MRSAVQLAASVIAAVFFCFSAPAADASAWDEIRGSVYGTKVIADGRGIVTLTAPYRPEDMRKVPIGMSAAFKDGRTIKTVTFLIDENPTPVVAVFHMGAGRDSVAITSNFRVDRQSDVRAVVEASDGQLYMVSQLVKFAGGQASCSAPPQGNPAEIAANMGKMQLAQLPTEGIASPLLGRAKLDLNHPNHTGMVMDQQTLLYTPIKMVSEITVQHGDDLIFRTVGSIALSQDPSITFDFKRANIQDLTITMKDTDGGSWTHTFPISPQS
jgi:sulfur-oxidizing protein SoxY